jgi:putative peptidoglycan lipid II flippase
LAAAAAFLMLATAASRVLGLIREQVMLYYMGLGADMGAFTVAFKVPNLVRTLVADTALSAAFIPVFSDLLARGRRAEAWQAARTILLLTTLILGVISILGMVFAPQVIHLAAPGYSDPDTIGLAIDLTRIMFPTVVILGLVGICIGIVNSYDHFTIPALAPIVWNLVIIAAVVGFTAQYGFYALAWGVTLGTVAELVIHIPAVWRRREGRGLGLGLRDPAVRQVGRLLAPVVLTLGIVNFNALIGTMVASYISEPAPAVIDKAFRLFQLPQGMFAVAIGTVLFPTLSRLAASGRFDEFRGALSIGLRQIFFVTLPFTAFFVVLGEPTVRLVFEHGKVTPADTEQVAWALAFFSLGMAFVSANTLLNRAFYGIQRPWLPLTVGVANLALNTVLCLVLYKPLGVGGITLATAMVSAFNCVALIGLLRRQIGGIDGRAVARTVLLSVVALIPLTVAGFGVWWVVDAWLGRSVWAQLASVSLGYLAGFAAYALTARFLHMVELHEVLAVARRRRATPRATEEALLPDDEGVLPP